MADEMFGWLHDLDPGLRIRLDKTDLTKPKGLLIALMAQAGSDSTSRAGR